MAVATAANAGEHLRLATGTTPENSGLLAVLLAPFEKRSGIEVDVIPVGTGKALELAENGEPEDVAPIVAYLLSDAARHVTGQVYTAVGGKIAVWNQPRELRAMYKDGRWTPEEIAARIDSTVGQERMAMIDRLEAMRHAAASGEKPNA